ncbi:Histone-lysine N-methyltransferase trithorax [Frankliniella fusca]|uniref:Histone-lysine N-methyltransferase trithorax n=1 Tax=Frankliniella fusca TaxID=407009 RepID=A0AAE1LNG4_9NEOP|nr:Histone-lysine N-methyltransferase trithorax [Frankliniella fusca]
MVRSKFPGKPSKIVNRKVVKSKKFCALHDNESSKAAENISYGLAVFNETFGDHEQVSTAFHGFSPHEIEKAKVIAISQQDKVEQEYLRNGLNFSPEDACPVKIDLPTPQLLTYVKANLSLIGPVGFHSTRAQCQSLQSSDVGVDESKPFSSCKLFNPHQSNLKKHVANRLLQRAKKSTFDSLPSSKLLPTLHLDKNGVISKKFVLPSRSMRSLRVIKPNKRFMESEENEKGASDNSEQLSLSRIIELKKPRLILDSRNECLTVKSVDGKVNFIDDGSVLSTPSSSGSNGNKEHVTFGELNVFGAPTTRSSQKVSQTSNSEGSPVKEISTPLTSNSQSSKSGHLQDPSSPSRSKLILRESKLNISPTLDQNQKLLPSKPKKALGVAVLKSPGTSIECTVCGAVRFHRLTKQSFKFGSICCDPCRKFITKMMMRSKSAESSVPCEIGQGNCAVSSYRGESFATKVNRCSACWLLLCVQQLVNMPEKIRDSLIRMLPANMQGMTVVLMPVTNISLVPTSGKRRKKGQGIQDATDKISTSPNKALVTQCTPKSSRKLSTSSSNKRISQTPIARIKRKAALVSLANNLRRVRERTHSSASTPNATKIKLSSREPLAKQSKIQKVDLSQKLKSSEKAVRGASKNLQKTKDGQARQKLSLKGPRVKHVCRSASIVLGQPLATFPIKSLDVSTIESNCLGEIAVTSEVAAQRCNDFKFSEGKLHDGAKALSEEESGWKHKLTGSKLLSEAADSVQSNKIITKSLPESTAVLPGRKITKHVFTSHHNKSIKKGQRRTLQDLGVCNTPDIVPELISLDFWESYDPDEVCNAGFGLIGFGSFVSKPICFLCGSAGKKKLIHCAACCEPYHKFCVEMGVGGWVGPVASQSNTEEWRVDWVCPRCTVCYSCGQNTGHQLTVCQRCHHSYHFECLGTSSSRKTPVDRLLICSSCLRCKSCNSSDVTKFVGNLPFCKICFKLRQKGNFCPLCQGCYTDDDYSSKMMECADCKQWVHAKCEGLSDEKYQVLSYLPESVEFICRLCCSFPPAPWWLAVESEIQAGYSNIIKAITKNRRAYAMLKWSPQKTCDCQQQSTFTVPRVSVVSNIGKRRLSFNMLCNDVELSSSSNSNLEKISRDIVLSKENPSVFEFDDAIEAGENTPITKFTSAKEKEKEVLHYSGSNFVQTAQFSPKAGSQSDSGVGSTDDELKASSATEEDDIHDKKANVRSLHECHCNIQNLNHPFTSLLAIKKKVHNCEYPSIHDFHRDMDQLINEAESEEVKELYHQTIKEVFPWFDPKYHRVSSNSFPMSPCKPHQGSLLLYQSNVTSPDKLIQNASPSNVLERLLPKSASGLGDEYFYYNTKVEDDRLCGLCKLVGDGEANAEGRLLYCGHSEWVHVNCALWSAEVFEEIDGALQNVNNALSRGRMIRCSFCGKKGASVGCCAKKCEETLHFPCARLAGFVFMEDKNVFCPSHMKDAPGKPLERPSDFDVCRPVFVELDRRKKKCIESKHVKVMIGSLLVQNLGTIIPDVSDQTTYIVPSEFSCTRLFWSSKEPWRVVRYSIRTTIRMPVFSEPVSDPVEHITVDHSKELLSLNPQPTYINKTVAVGERISDKLTSDFTSPVNHEVTDFLDNQTKLNVDSDVKIIESLMVHILDSVCSRETDEEVTDPQTSADLLPPELKDAIFEDLPHDLLDGISMQDIFQDKYLSFDELGRDEAHDEANSSKCDFEKTRLKTLKACKELKRSKSDVLPSNSSQVDTRLNQRSCSLAWSYKLGTSLRLSVKPAPSVDLHYCIAGTGDKGKENKSLTNRPIMQVDGSHDVCSESEDSDSEIMNTSLFCNLKGKDDESTMTFTKNFAEDSALLCKKIECLKSITSAALYQNTMIGLVSEGFSNEDFKKGKRRKAKRNSGEKIYVIPQLDGVTDLSSDSEQEGALNKPNNTEEKPVRCSKCGCTYRTEESYTRHIPSCSGDFSLTTSESEAEITDDEAVTTIQSASSPSPDSAISVSSGSQPLAPSVSPTGLSAAAASLSGSLRVSSDLPVQPQTALCTSNEIQVSTPKPPTSSSNVINSISKVQKIQNTKSKSTKTFQQQTAPKLVRGNNSILHQQIYRNNQQQIRHQAIQPALPTSIPQQASQIITMLDYQHSQQTGPTVLVQSVPSQSMVPAYLEAFQQHTGQNLQYLATVDNGANFGKTQYLTAVPSAVLPGAYQLQAIPDGQLCLEPSPVGIPTLSNIQLAQAQLAPASISQTQPQVLGTLLPNPISCNVVATEPIYETIQMFPDQSGGMLLASQPVLTCMETVVSNTYMTMSSSQFVSSSIPGMLQGSSTYSTTTTQVFQSSKVDPPVMDVPTQYLVVNTHPSLSDAAVGKLEVMSLSQSQVQDRAPIQAQDQVHLSAINLPVPVTAPLPSQTLPSVIPTSVVTPMPRTQPQRTYSKPSKVAKDAFVGATSVVKKHLPQMTCSAIKEAMTLISSQPSLKKISSATGNSDICSSNVETKFVLHGSVPKNMSNVQTDNNVMTSVQASSLTTDSAPPQKVTLPDPVKCNLPVPINTKVPPVTTAPGPMKCPPVTFSYRAHAVEKNKLKKNFLLNANGIASTSKNNIVQTKAPSAKLNNPHPNFSEQQIAASLPVLNPAPKTICTSEKQTPEVINDTPSLSKKPIAAIPPLTQTGLASEAKEIKLDKTSNLATSKASAFVSSASEIISANSKPIIARGPSMSASLSPAGSTCAVPSSLNSSPPSRNQVGKNASLSLTTASITNSVTSSSSSLTVSMNSVKPVSSSKPQRPNTVGLKPLKEINKSEWNHDVKSLQSKTLDKDTSDIPPAVLKSSCLNINDPQKKTESFQCQSETPTIYPDGDNTSSIKLLFQKQSHNGCYKVSSSPGKKDGELMAVKLADINIIYSGSKDKKGGKHESENVKPAEKSVKKNQLEPDIVYEIHCQDGFSYSSNSISDAWQKVFGAVQEARANHKMPPLIHNPFNSIESGPNIMGLGNNSLKYVLEQLPGVSDCSNYRPVYHKSRLPGSGYKPFKREDYDMSKESQSGCARTEPFLSAKKYDMFSWLDSRHRRPPKLLDNTDIERTASTSLPMAMRFRHLRETSKTSVGVFRSDIHGRGLFCLRDIEAGEMVIEYAGEVIRNTLTDNREKYYQSKGIGCYMFKVDDNFTVDATLKGNAARFINHSCEPNCYSRIVDILGKKHIIIFAFRRIPQGEELTYDYKFPIEDEKIHCHCLARRCRKYLN